MNCLTMPRMIPPAVVRGRCVEIAEALEASDMPRLTAAIDRAEVDGYGVPPIPWARARERFEEDAGISPTHWLATVRPDGRPHVMPVWTAWVEGAFYFVSSATTRKRKNLAHCAHCVITVASSGLDLVVEGEAAKVSDQARLQRIADAYALQGWHPTVRNGVFYADYEAPSAGPPPYEVYEATPVRSSAWVRTSPMARPAGTSSSWLQMVVSLRIPCEYDEQQCGLNLSLALSEPEFGAAWKTGINTDFKCSHGLWSVDGSQRLASAVVLACMALEALS